MRACRVEIFRTLHDPAASSWLKNALRFALMRDPVDASLDAEYLSALLCERAAALEEIAKTVQAAQRTDSPWDDLMEP